MAVVVKERIDAWLQERPVNQAPLLDERSGEKVSYLFQFRGKRMGAGYPRHKPHLAKNEDLVYRGISGEQFHGNKAS